MRGLVIAAAMGGGGCATAVEEAVSPTPGPRDSGIVGDDSGGDTGQDTGESPSLGPTPAFDRFCTAPWESTAVAATLPDQERRSHTYASDHADYKRGTMEVQKFIPPHPFHVTTIRVDFADGQGDAEISLANTMGRSYPAGYPDLDTEGARIAGPFALEVDATWGEEDAWTEIDVAELGIFLLPTQHYAVVNEYPKKGAPTLAIERSPQENSRALLIKSGEDMPYGLPGDYRVELGGEYFCAWTDADRWFQPVETPFQAIAAGNVATVDLDGDDHLDFVAITPGDGPMAWSGDGGLGFGEGQSRWPGAETASWLLFGDVDNDGDLDAFAASYVGADDDGDGVAKSEGDCNDADASIHPGATEVPNGFDDDCDGIADDGTSTEDLDRDGVTVADGDCDDTRDEVAPGLPELKDGMDNGCDGIADEDFGSQIFLNDGDGNFSVLAGAGVGTREPSTAGGFGDGNEDGFLDLYYGNWLRHYPDDAAVQDRYYEGLGGGYFEDARERAGVLLPTPWSCYGFSWNDYDDDGHPDMLVANYHLYDNQLWQNQGDGTFLDVAPAVGAAHDEIPSEYRGYPGGHSYGGDFGDIDNDGDDDYFQANLSHPRTAPWADPSTLLINSGAPGFTFTNERAARGLIYDEGDVQGQFGDYDNDGDLDLLVSSLYATHYPRVYQNDGLGFFTDVTYEVGLAGETSWGILWADYDEDGDLDLVATASYGDTRIQVLENVHGNSSAWVELFLVGTNSNRDAAGARVLVDAGGVRRRRVVQMGGGSFNQQRPPDVHVGLGDATSIDSVTVRWVGGEEESFSGVTPRGRFVLVEGSGVAVPR